MVLATLALLVLGSGVYAQGRRARGRRRATATVTVTAGSVTAVEGQSRVITIPIAEVNNMMQRQRVWLLAPPPGSSAFGLGVMGGGRRVWALLPSCRRPDPDDPRDPCPVGRVSMEVLAGTGEIRSGEPQTVTPSPDSRRVQSFVVPPTVTQVRVRIHRRDDSVRYEAGVDAAQFAQLPAPVGQAGGPHRFTFELTRYPAL